MKKTPLMPPMPDELEATLEQFPEAFRDIVKRSMRESHASVCEYLARVRPELEALNAEDVVMSTVGRLSTGLTPHPDIALAAIKLLGELLELREAMGKT